MQNRISPKGIDVLQATEEIGTRVPAQESPRARSSFQHRGELESWMSHESTISITSSPKIFSIDLFNQEDDNDGLFVLQTRDTHSSSRVLEEEEEEEEEERERERERETGRSIDYARIIA